MSAAVRMRRAGWDGVLGLLLALVTFGLALAQVPSPPGAPDYASVLSTYDAQASSIETQLQESDLEQVELQAMLQTLINQRDALPAYIEQIRAREEPIRRQLDALGPPPENGTEAESVAAERRTLGARFADLEALRRRLEQADARAGALIDRLNDVRRRQLTERLLTRQPSPVLPSAAREALGGVFDLVADVGREFRRRLADTPPGAAPLALRLAGPLGAVLVAGALLFHLRRRALGWLVRYLDQPLPASRKILVGFGLTVGRLFLPSLGLALLLAVALASRLLGLVGEELLEGLARAALYMIAAYACASAYFSPLVPQLRLSHLNDACAASANRCVVMLAGLYGLDTLFIKNAEQLDLSVETVQLANLSLLVFGALAVWRFERALASYSAEPETDPGADEDDADAVRPSGNIAPTMMAIARGLLLLVAVCAPILALSGYFAASRFVFYKPLVTAALIGFLVLVFTVVRELVEALVRRTIDAALSAPGATKGTSTARRLRLIPVLVGFVLVSAAVPLIALIWGAERGDLITGLQAIRNGVSIGEVTLAPVDIGVFLLVFVIVFTIAKLVQAVLTRSVLPLTGLDAGGRAAVSAGVGYLGLVLAFLAGIGAAGLDLSSLAIVAGALSVGIGFGLQAIVNNFVSGLILLAERPIKPGDWVQLPSGMGYVQRINVRSTVIETFDRASLIVPNSELISATVINWTHTNLNGRIIVGVRAAFGSDPREVERILLEIARAHPLVLRRPQPFVLFRGYNDYAMLFEVRAVLRDVNWILNAQSDFYFEIHRRFAEAGIDIPVQSSRVTLERAGPAVDHGAFVDEPVSRPAIRAVPHAPPHGPGEPAIAGGDGDGR